MVYLPYKIHDYLKSQLKRDTERGSILQNNRTRKQVVSESLYII